MKKNKQSKPKYEIPKIINSFQFDTVPFVKLEPEHESYDIQNIRRKLLQLETRLKEVSFDGESSSETLDRIIRISGRRKS